MLKCLKLLLLIALMQSAALVAHPHSLAYKDTTVSITTVNRFEISPKPILIDIQVKSNKLNITYYGALVKDTVGTASKELIDLLRELYAAKVEDIERKEANKDRHIMDGYQFYLKETTSSGVRQIYADSPDEKSHPLLYGILRKCMDMYELKHPFKNIQR